MPTLANAPNSRQGDGRCAYMLQLTAWPTVPHSATQRGGWPLAALSSVPAIRQVLATSCTAMSAGTPGRPSAANSLRWKDTRNAEQQAPHSVQLTRKSVMMSIVLATTQTHTITACPS